MLRIKNMRGKGVTAPTPKDGGTRHKNLQGNRWKPTPYYIKI